MEINVDFSQLGLFFLKTPVFILYKVINNKTEGNIMLYYIEV